MTSPASDVCGGFTSSHTVGWRKYLLRFFTAFFLLADGLITQTAGQQLQQARPGLPVHETRTASHTAPVQMGTGTASGKAVKPAYVVPQKSGDAAGKQTPVNSLSGVHMKAGINDTIVLAGYIVNGDTLGHIWLGNVDVVDKMIYHNDAERIKYLTLRRDVLKVLPYARSAGYKYRMLEWQLSQTTDRKKKREFIGALEKDIKDNYEKPLKDLTITQGRILIKLLDRETGQTSYELLKDLKSGFSAFMFQSVAGLIGDNLKDHYDPQQDKDIEFIIQSYGY